MSIDERSEEVTSGGRQAVVRIGVMIFVGLAASSAYLTRHCIAVANTSIQADLSLSDEQMGWVLGAFSAGYFIFQIPGGWLGNRIGSRAAFPLISTLWSLFTLWTAASMSYASMLASRAVFGAAQAGLVPLSAKVINDWFPVNWRGVCSGVVGASMSIGGVITMGLTAELMLHYDWREVFRGYSLVGIVWAIAFYLFFRTLPEEHPWMRAARDDSPDRDIGSERGPTADDVKTESVAAELSSGEVFLHMIGSLTFWGINVQSFFRAAGYGLLVTWLPAFLEYRFGVSNDEAGKYTMYPLAGVILGSLSGGLLIDAILKLTGNKWISRSGVAFVSLGVCGVLMLAASQAAAATMFVVLMAAASYFSGLASPPAWAATMDVAGRYTSVVVGAMNMAGTVGAFMMPIVLGYMIGDIKETGGDWNLVIYFVAAIYLLGSACWLAVNPNDAPPGEAVGSLGTENSRQS
ncbi:MAG: MFS transporter [Planctomycetota bacterium]|nr:MAG: MFS transporter [Planctomycetota bacterium]REJ94754.1 MAG: MFS transporter [Planctomycetota bacterium]REK29210.1 MAG: MFS transporter [Planctomycetota bacterium]REK29394.1 MAG: MFS transporter [Planctomycetota bacterium]